MKYPDHLNKFWQLSRSGKVQPESLLLYSFLCDLLNAQFWATNSIDLSKDDILKVIKVGNNVLRRMRDDLEQAKLIKVSTSTGLNKEGKQIGIKGSKTTYEVLNGVPGETLNKNRVPDKTLTDTNDHLGSVNRVPVETPNKIETPNRVPDRTPKDILVSTLLNGTPNGGPVETLMEELNLNRVPIETPINNSTVIRVPVSTLTHEFIDKKEVNFATNRVPDNTPKNKIGFQVEPLRVPDETPNEKDTSIVEINRKLLEEIKGMRDLVAGLSEKVQGLESQKKSSLTDSKKNKRKKVAPKKENAAPEPPPVLIVSEPGKLYKRMERILEEKYMADTHGDEFPWNGKERDHLRKLVKMLEKGIIGKRMKEGHDAGYVVTDDEMVSTFEQFLRILPAWWQKRYNPAQLSSDYSKIMLEIKKSNDGENNSNFKRGKDDFNPFEGLDYV